MYLKPFLSILYLLNYLSKTESKGKQTIQHTDKFWFLKSKSFSSFVLQEETAASEVSL
jgi:hypothetical protein